MILPTMLTVDATRPYDQIAEAYGVVCQHHGQLRDGITQPHAINLEKKHLRESHPELVGLQAFHISDLARVLLDAVEAKGDGARKALMAWAALTGPDLPAVESVLMLRRLATAEEPVTAVVAPF